MLGLALWGLCWFRSEQPRNCRGLLLRKGMIVVANDVGAGATAGGRTFGRNTMQLLAESKKRDLAASRRARESRAAHGRARAYFGEPDVVAFFNVFFIMTSSTPTL